MINRGRKLKKSERKNQEKSRSGIRGEIALNRKEFPDTGFFCGDIYVGQGW